MREFIGLFSSAATPNIQSCKKKERKKIRELTKSYFNTKQDKQYIDHQIV